MQLPARLYAPGTAAALPALLYLLVAASPLAAWPRMMCCAASWRALGRCMVLSLDYRLAPEHAFPTASNDAWDALAWLAANAARLGADPGRLAVDGDSAGGTLAAVNAIGARRGPAAGAAAAHLPGHHGAPGHAVAYRVRARPDTRPRRHRLVLRPVHSQPRRARDWRFAPLLAPDVDGVAPAWIGLAECDPLVDEGVEYGDKLRAAGVAVDLEIYRGVTHSEFIKMGRAIAEARRAHQDAARALRAQHRRAKPMQRQDFRCFHRLRVRWAEVDIHRKSSSTPIT